MRKIAIAMAIVVVGGVFLVQKTEKMGSTGAESAPKLSLVQRALSVVSTGGIETQAQKAEGRSEWKKLLDTVRDLHFKVIRTPDDDRVLTKILGSRKNIDAASREVLSLNGHDLEENQKSRMDGVLFFMRALELKNNPERKYLENKIAEIILKEDLEVVKDLPLKKSAAADRMELFVALSEKSPEVAEHVKEQAKSEFQKRILQFAVNFYNLDKKEN